MTFKMFRNILRAIVAVIYIAAAIAVIWGIFRYDEINLTPIKIISGLIAVWLMLFLTAFVSYLNCIKIPATQLALKR